MEAIYISDKGIDGEVILLQPELETSPSIRESWITESNSKPSTACSLTVTFHDTNET